MTGIIVFVPGIPVAQGSMRSPRAGVVLHSSDKLKTWRESVGWIAKEMWKGGPLIEGPVRLQAWFRFPRPKTGHKWRHWKATSPDIDKLLRALCDALEGVVYKNDAQVALVVVTKLWADAQFEPGVRFAVASL